MARVFISYRSTERSLVQKLADDIEKLGHDVWFDEQLTGGHKWWEQILDEIRRADIIVMALSPAALDARDVVATFAVQWDGRFHYIRFIFWTVAWSLIN